MASFIFILGVLLLTWDALPTIVKIMMCSALVVTAFGYNNLSLAFDTRSRRNYLPPKTRGWK